MKINIKKPIHSTYVGINETKINQAISLGEMLEITIPQGTGTADPIEWMKTGKRIEKVFLYPDRPMVLYTNYVKIVDTKQLVFC